MHVYKTPAHEPRTVPAGKIGRGKWFESEGKTFLSMGWEDEPTLITAWCYEDKRTREFLSFIEVTPFKAATLSIARF